MGTGLRGCQFGVSDSRVQEILKRAATLRGMQLTPDGRIAMPRPKDPAAAVREFEVAALRD